MQGRDAERRGGIAVRVDARRPERVLGWLLFPPEDPADANLFEYKAFSDEEYQAYAELFSDVINV